MHTLKFYVFAGEFPALLQHDCDARANSERPRGMYQLTYKLQSIVFADSSSIVYLILCERQHCMEKKSDCGGNSPRVKGKTANGVMHIDLCHLNFKISVILFHNAGSFCPH